MKRFACMLAALALFSGAVTAEGPVKIDDAIMNVAKGLVAKLPSGTKVVIYGIEADTPAISDYIIEQLTSDLLQVDGLVVVDRQNLDAIRKELALQTSGDVSDESAQRVGAMLGAEVLVTGSFGKLAEKYRLAAKAVKVETSEIRYLSNQTVLSDATTENLYGRKAGAAKAADTMNAAAKTVGDMSGRLVCSMINPFFGIGSFVQGDTGTGTAVLIAESASIAAILVGGIQASKNPDNGTFLIVAGCGGFLISGVYAIVMPWAYNRNPKLAEALEGVSVTSLPDGSLSVGYTVSF